MSAPKSVVKFNKNGVSYESSVDKASYYMFELSRRALMDVGRYVRKQFVDSYKATFKQHTGLANKSIQYKVFSSKNTKYPRIEISFKGTKGFYSSFQEFGTSTIPKRGLLTHAVEDNIAEIIKIESQYLSALEDEAEALALVNEEELEGGGED